MTTTPFRPGSRSTASPAVERTGDRGDGAIGRRRLKPRLFSQSRPSLCLGMQTSSEIGCDAGRSGIPPRQEWDVRHGPFVLAARFQRTPVSASPMPAPAVVGGIRARAIAAGAAHTCAVQADSGAVWCWGWTSDGQLGEGTIGPGGRAMPTQSTSPAGATTVVAGYSFTCALESDQTVWCWGANEYGQLGRTTFTPREAAPAPVSQLSNVRFLSARFDHVCALLKDRTLRCWGHGRNGELANRSDKNSAVPVP